MRYKKKKLELHLPGKTENPQSQLLNFLLLVAAQGLAVLRPSPREVSWAASSGWWLVDIC